MLDDFFTRALIGGVGVALVAGPLGCFVVWRRMAYFGDTIAHAALLGVVLAFVLDINLIAGVFAIGSLTTLALLLLQRTAPIPSDALLGILSHSTLAVGLVILGFLSHLRIDLMGYLFGDVLAISRLDVIIIWLGGAAVLALLVAIWRPLLAGTVSPALAQAEGLRPEASRLVFMILLSAVIAIAMQIVGILLITALLIIPAAAARRVSSTPEVMALMAAGIGAGAVVAGLYGSLAFDTASGPSIVVAALLAFVVSLMRLRTRQVGGSVGGHPPL